MYFILLFSRNFRLCLEYVGIKKEKTWRVFEIRSLNNNAMSHKNTDFFKKIQRKNSSFEK